MDGYMNYIKSGNEVNGSWIEHSPLNMYVYSTTTDANGDWSIDYELSSVSMVIPQAVFSTVSVANEAIVTLHNYDSTSASGSVIESDVVVLASEALEYSGAGITVNVLIIGN